MPNYGLIIDSTYNPMSFAEYAAPFEKYAEVYKEMADSYDALEIEANKWEKLALSEKDKDAYKKYLDYAKELRNAANDLAENGLNTKTRGLVSQMRKRYSSEIQPMEDAYTYIQDKIKAQELIKALNPRVVFDKDFSNDVGIKDVLQNPYLSYNYIDLDSVEEDAMKAASAQSSRRIDILNDPLLGEAFRLYTQGYSVPNLIPYIENASTFYPEINTLYETLKTKYGSYGEKVNDAIMLGMLLGYTANSNPIQTASIVDNDDGSSSEASSGLGSSARQIPLASYTIIKDANGNTRLHNTDNPLPEEVDRNNLPIDWLYTDSQGNRTGVTFNREYNPVGELYAQQISGTDYVIMNANTGLPYRDSNNQIVTYDMANQKFDTDDFSVTDLPVSTISSEGNIFKIKNGRVSSSTIYDPVSSSNTSIGVPITSTTELEGIEGLPNNITLDKYDVYVKTKTNGSIKSVTVIPREVTRIPEQGNTGNLL